MSRPRQRATRKLVLESLDTRTLLAADLALLVDCSPSDSGPAPAPLESRAEGEGETEQRGRHHRNGGRNPLDAADVNGDFRVQPDDILPILSDAIVHGTRSLDDVANGSELEFLDANDDRLLSIQDVIPVLNALVLEDEVAGVFSHLRGVVLTASGSPAGEVEYEVERERLEVHQHFQVQIEHQAPDTTFGVMVDGVAVGEIHTDSLGQGVLLLSNDASTVGASPFPADFPDVVPGSVVAIAGVGDSTLSIEVVGAPTPTTPSHLVHAHAFLFGDGAGVGEAEYEVEVEDNGLKQSLQIQVEHAVPGAYTISVADIAIGTLQVGTLGSGRVRFSSQPGPGELPLPANMPDITDGTTVTVANGAGGGLAGSFGVGIPLPTDPLPLLVAPLTGPTTARGAAELSSDLEHGMVDVELEIEVEDGVPNSTHDVTIGGFAVGSLTLDSRGRGKLKLSAGDLPFASPLPLHELLDGLEVVVGAILSGRFAPQRVF